MPGFLGYRGGRGSSRSRGTLGKFAKFRGPALRAGNLPIYSSHLPIYSSPMPVSSRPLPVSSSSRHLRVPSEPCTPCGNLRVSSRPIRVSSRPLRVCSLHAKIYRFISDLYGFLSCAYRFFPCLYEYIRSRAKIRGFLPGFCGYVYSLCWLLADSFQASAGYRGSLRGCAFLVFLYWDAGCVLERIAYCFLSTGRMDVWRTYGGRERENAPFIFITGGFC